MQHNTLPWKPNKYNVLNEFLSVSNEHVSLKGGGEPDRNPNQNNTAMKYQLIIYIYKPLLYQYIAFIRRVLIEII